MAEIQANIKILPVKHPHLYQKLAQKAMELHLLGMSYSKIGKILGIDPKTVKKAIRR
jgi:DNA-binding CsgD family transcriptional regulator